MLRLQTPKGDHEPAVSIRCREEHQDDHPEEDPIDAIKLLPTQVRCKGGIVNTLGGVDPTGYGSHGWVCSRRRRAESESSKTERRGKNKLSKGQRTFRRIRGKARNSPVCV